MNTRIIDPSVLGISHELWFYLLGLLSGFLLASIFWILWFGTRLRYRFIKIIESVQSLEETDFENLYVQDFTNKPESIVRCVPIFKNTFKEFSDLIWYMNKFLIIFMSPEKTETFSIIFLKKMKIHDYLTLFLEKSLQNLTTYRSISIMFEVTEIEKETLTGKMIRELIDQGLHQRIMNTQAAEFAK